MSDATTTLTGAIAALKAQIAVLEGIHFDTAPAPATPAVGGMHVNDRFFEFIKEREELRLQTYTDSGGVRTIGYGHTGPDVVPGRVITEGEAKDILVKDVGWAIDAVNHDITVPLGQNQFNALVSFVFNIGSGSFHTSTLRRLLNTGDYGSVPTQLRRWIYDQQGNPVLVGRREEEVKLWQEPDTAVAT